MKIAIIGAGMTGASAASCLQHAGFQVEVFDKGRSVGGRMSSKRSHSGGYLDLGAQYFTVRDPAFQQLVANWQAQGDVAVWPFTPYTFAEHLEPSADEQLRFVGTPSMQQPIKSLLVDIPVHLQCRIVSIEQQTKGRYCLIAEDGQIFNDYTAVIITTPPAQAEALLTNFPALQQQIPSDILQPCWAVMLEQELGRSANDPSDQQALVTALEAKGIFGQTADLRWLCQLQDKPRREQQSGKIQWLIHFSTQFTRQHLASSPEQIVAIAKIQLQNLLGTTIEISQTVCHRWLYATVDESQSPPGVIHNAHDAIWLAGDWCLGGRIENAWLAGQQAAQQLISQCQQP